MLACVREKRQTNGETDRLTDIGLAFTLINSALSARWIPLNKRRFRFAIQISFNNSHAKKVEIISRADLTCVAYGWPACVAFSITGIPKVARAINWSELQLGCVYSGLRS